MSGFAMPCVSVAATVIGGGAVSYSAAAGERNRLDIVGINQLTIRVSDAGAVIEPVGPGCRSIDAHTAECTAAYFPESSPFIVFAAALGDMDDSVKAHGPVLKSADGGPGDDVLEADPTSGEFVVFTGGDGHDTLLGGAGGDVLHDGETSGAADSDVFDGRGGRDDLFYATRTAPVRVDLRQPGRGGETGELDALRSVEAVTGGSGADVLRGGNGSDTLAGGAGRDRLYGGRGSDWLRGDAGADLLRGGWGGDLIDGGGGRDRMSGGRGRDDLYPTGRGADRIWCGPSRDSVLPSANLNVLHASCESASFDGSDFEILDLDPSPYRRDHRSATFRLRCPHREYPGDVTIDSIPIHGAIRIRGGRGFRRQLGIGRIPPAVGRRCDSEKSAPEWVPVRVVLNALGRRLSSRTGGAEVVVSLRGRLTARWRIRLTVPR
jgi:hypothetical protein